MTAAAYMPPDIRAWNAAQDDVARPICDRLATACCNGLPEATAKVRHTHPIWFLAANPGGGDSRLTSCVRLLFRRAQSFADPGLTPEGTFRAAEARVAGAVQIDGEALARWLGKARAILWDYSHIRRNRGLVPPKGTP